MCVDTVTPLLQTDIKYAYEFGGEKVVFDKEELGKIRAYSGQPRLVLLGFKPSETLKYQMNVKHASFIYPNETEVAGSSAVFANLLEAMISLEKIAICQLIARENSSCSLVALIPDVFNSDLIYPFLEFCLLWIPHDSSSLCR